MKIGAIVRISRKNPTAPGLRGKVVSKCIGKRAGLWWVQLENGKQATIPEGDMVKED